MELNRRQGETDMTVSVLLEGFLKEGERDGFTALLTDKFKVTRTFDGFQTIDLTYNVDDPSNWVITELWDTKEAYQKYLQFRQTDGTLDEVGAVCVGAPSVRIFDIVDTSA
jgi:quinol monooxygenase YgiN